ncbi:MULTISPECIES: hypothetical protein [Methylobacterium]|nr:hypothetical protein [Methylobacterium sp. WL19]TXN26494.1 hypothetical protein FV220_14940 [Methylobacterium sp. WL19]
MTHLFTTLRHPVEKLREAEHFLGRLAFAGGLEFQFELNAFLSASRSVTFLLQCAMAKVPGFADWYGAQQTSMKSDAAMRFFVELRNISQKQGPVSFVGGSLQNGGWTYRFVGRPHAVPEDLVGKDICACCASHLSKLARLLAECANEFPFQSCPGRAFTVEGMNALKYDWRDAEEAAGLPPGYTQVSGIPAAEMLRLLRREIEPLDTKTIERIGKGDMRVGEASLSFHQSNGDDLVDALASRMDATDGNGTHPRDVFLSSILTRIDEIEREGH